MQRYLLKFFSLFLLSASWLLADDIDYVFISDVNASQVIVLNSATYDVVTRIDVGVIPGAMTISPDRSELYVANLGSDSVTVININSLTINAIITVGSQPYFGVVFSPNGEKAYVTNAVSNTVSVINTSTHQLLDTIPVGNYPATEVVTLDGSKLYVSNGHGSSVSVINTANDDVIATLDVSPYSYVLAMNPTGDKIFVISIIGQSNIIDTTTDTLLSDIIPTGNLPYNCIFNHDGSLCYITNTVNNKLTVLESSTLNVLRTIDLNTNNARGLALSLDGTKLFIGSYEDGKLFVLDTSTYEQLAVVDFGIPLEFITTLSPIAIQPPSSPLIQQNYNSFFQEGDLINTISWSAPVSGVSPSSYRIYRDEGLSDLVATITTDSPLIFRDHHRKKGETSSYYIVSLTQAGQLSQPVNLEI